MLRWQDLPEAIDEWATTLDPTARELRKVAASVITDADVGYYLDPFTARVGLYVPAGTDRADRALVKSAASRLGGEVVFLSYQALADPDAAWVKVAYSPTLRRGGELLNFFPGQYPGGVPNHPSPAAAMLTSGLLGAGLGWAGGRVAKKVLPKGYGDKMPRTGLLLGAALGALPGAAWAGTNKLIDRPWNDPAVLDGARGAEPIEYPSAIDGTNAAPDSMEDAGHNSKLLQDAASSVRNSPVSRIKIGADLDAVELSPRCRHAIEKAADAFGHREREYEALPTDVNINALGQTLWDTGASPQLAGSTMGAMYAAQQMPDPRSRPGLVTGNQLGQLAANAVGDYARGRLAGFALNQIIGSPISSRTFGYGNAALGLIGAVVPKLFGG